MRVPRLALSLLVCFVVATSLSAQQSSSATSDPQAVSFLQSSLTAQTGDSPVNDVTMTGTVTVSHGTSTESGTITMAANSAGQSKIAISLPSGNWVTTADYSASPRTATTTDPSGTIRKTPPADLIGPSPAWFYPPLLVGPASQKSYVASDEGTETRSGSKVRHISIWPQSSSNSLMTVAVVPGQVLSGPGASQPTHLGQEELYFNPSSMLPQTLVLRITGYREKNSAPDPAHPIFLPKEIQYSDYQQVQGRVVASHIRVSVLGVSIMDIHLSSITFNTGNATAAAN